MVAATETVIVTSLRENDVLLDDGAVVWGIGLVVLGEKMKERDAVCACEVKESWSLEREVDCGGGDCPEAAVESDGMVNVGVVDGNGIVDNCAGSTPTARGARVNSAAFPVRCLHALEEME